MQLLAVSTITDLVAVLTALTGLIGVLVAAYNAFKPKKDKDEPEPEDRPEDHHRYDHVSDTHDPDDLAMINELKAALAESRTTVHALRRRLDHATGLDTSKEPPKDWLSGS